MKTIECLFCEIRRKWSTFKQLTKERIWSRANCSPNHSGQVDFECSRRGRQSSGKAKKGRWKWRSNTRNREWLTVLLLFTWSPRAFNRAIQPVHLNVLKWEITDTFPNHTFKPIAGIMVTLNRQRWRDWICLYTSSCKVYDLDLCGLTNSSLNSYHQPAAADCWSVDRFPFFCSYYSLRIAYTQHSFLF